MWALILIVTTLVEIGGPKLSIQLPDRSTFFSTEESCNVERKRITEAMRTSYPGDTDYYLECRSVKPVVRKGVNL